MTLPGSRRPQAYRPRRHRWPPDHPFACPAHARPRDQYPRQTIPPATAGSVAWGTEPDAAELASNLRPRMRPRMQAPCIVGRVAHKWLAFENSAPVPQHLVPGPCRVYFCTRARGRDTIVRCLKQHFIADAAIGAKGCKCVSDIGGGGVRSRRGSKLVRFLHSPIHSTQPITTPCLQGIGPYPGIPGLAPFHHGRYVGIQLQVLLQCGRFRHRGLVAFCGVQGDVACPHCSFQLRAIKAVVQF